MPELTDNEKRSIWSTLFHDLKNFTVAIVPASLETREVFPGDAGSGVCVQIAGKFFLATAAHVLLGRSVRANFIPSEDLSDRGPVILSGNLRGGHRYDSEDLGWLELHPGSTSKMGKSFLDLHRLRPYCNGSQENVIVFGSPVSDLQVSYTERTFSLKASPWGTNGLVDPVDIGDAPEADRLYLDWTRNVEGVEGWFERPRPHGLSGCGIWTLSERAPNWNWRNIQLIGIQTGVRERPDNHLVGFQIQSWLRMLREDRPELASAIDPILSARTINAK